MELSDTVRRLAFAYNSHDSATIPETDMPSVMPFTVATRQPFQGRTKEQEVVGSPERSGPEQESAHVRTGRVDTCRGKIGSHRTLGRQPSFFSR